jgi:hypothetical protein
MTTGSARRPAKPGRTGRPAPRNRWRAGTLAAAGTTPGSSVNARANLVGSEGHHPAHQRSAIPTRVYESGSGCGHDAAPARHPYPPRSPPVQAISAGSEALEPKGPPLQRPGCFASLRDGLRPPWTLEPLRPQRAGTTGRPRGLPRPPRLRPGRDRLHLPGAQPSRRRAAHSCAQTQRKQRRKTTPCPELGSPRNKA